VQLGEYRKKHRNWQTEVTEVTEEMGAADEDAQMSDGAADGR
jgi:hypothetical protein